MRFRFSGRTRVIYFFASCGRENAFARFARSPLGPVNYRFRKAVRQWKKFGNLRIETWNRGKKMPCKCNKLINGCRPNIPTYIAKDFIAGIRVAILRLSQFRKWWNSRAPLNSARVQLSGGHTNVHCGGKERRGPGPPFFLSKQRINEKVAHFYLPISISFRGLMNLLRVWSILIACGAGNLWKKVYPSDIDYAGLRRNPPLPPPDFPVAAPKITSKRNEHFLKWQQQFPFTLMLRTLINMISSQHFVTWY